MRRWGALAVFLWLLIEVFSVRPHPVESTKRPPHYLSGAIHVHSTYSDGGGTPEEIARAAKKAQLDFVVLTDHNDSRARLDGLEKPYDGVDLFVEMEASTPAGHALAFYSHTSAAKLPDSRVTDLAYEHLIGQGSPEGFFIVAAHPSNLKNPWTRFDRYPEGMEIGNFNSFWLRQLVESPLSFSATALTFPFNNYLSAVRFLRLFDKDLATWDTMNTISPRRFGIFGHDTHARLALSDALVIGWPDYESTFQIASNIVFLKNAPSPDFSERKKQIYTAIRDGRVAIAFQILHPFSDNDWSLVCPSQTYRSGDQISGANGCHFEVVLAGSFPIRLRLFQDGKQVYEAVTSERTHHIELTGNGLYRLELYAQMASLFHVALRHPVPYIFYNPIYIH